MALVGSNCWRSACHKGCRNPFGASRLASSVLCAHHSGRHLHGKRSRVYKTPAGATVSDPVTSEFATLSACDSDAVHVSQQHLLEQTAAGAGHLGHHQAARDHPTKDLAQELEDIFHLDAPCPTPDCLPLPTLELFTAGPVHMLPWELQQQLANLPRSSASCGVTEHSQVTWHSRHRHRATVQSKDAAHSVKLPGQAHPHPVEIHFASTMQDPNPAHVVIVDPLTPDVVDFSCLVDEQTTHEQQVHMLEEDADQAHAAVRRLRGELAAKSAAHEQELAQLRAQLAEATGNNSSVIAALPTPAPAPKPKVPWTEHGKKMKQLRSQTVTVDFSIECPTQYGQRVLVVGDHVKLGSWKPEAAVKLRWSEAGCWSGSANFTGETKTIRYKAVLEHAPGQYTWCSGDNITLGLAGQSCHRVQHTFTA